LIAPAFGAWLRQQRGVMSRDDLGQQLRAHVLVEMKVVGSAVAHWERGVIPPWSALAAYAAVYGIPLTDIAARLVVCLQTRDGRDLPCQPAGVGSADAPTPPGVLATLQADHDALRADVARIADIAGELLAVAVRARKTGGARLGTGAARPRRRRRG